MRRLFDIPGAAEYVASSESQVKAWLRNGDLIPVRLPSSRGSGASRRVHLDQQDLDAFIDRAKAASTGAPNEALSRAAIKGWQSSPVRRKRGAA